MEQRFDLTAASEVLTKRRIRLDFTRAVKRFADADSAKVDLELAQDRLMLARDFRFVRNGSDREELVTDPRNIKVAGSLMETAVLLYTKVVTDNDARGQINLMKGADQDIKKKHFKIIKLRNAGIGHFSYGESEAVGEWAQDRIIAVVNNSRITGYINPWLRTNYRAVIFRDLKALLDYSIPKIYEILEERNAIVTKMLTNLERDVWEVIQQFKVGKLAPETRAESLGVTADLTVPIHFSAPPRD